MNVHERGARGARIKELLSHADVQAALAEIEADIIAEWRKTPWFWRQKMKWNELRGLERLRTRLASYASQAPK
jgi:hypothetical protein